MQDRVPTKPNRYAVYDDAHNFIRYEYHERADEPTQEGDALNKANLLPDTVATALGLTGNPQVGDALLALAVGAGKYGYAITVKAPSGTPLPGVTVTGVTLPNGKPCITDENGYVLGVSISGAVTLGFNGDGYIDIKSTSKSVSATGIVTEVDFVVDTYPNNARKIITSSSLNFSHGVDTFDFFLVGGGGAGAYGGGAGGFTKTVLGSVANPNSTLSFVIGAGGAYQSGLDGLPGGNTSLLGVIAEGGGGGGKSAFNGGSGVGGSGGSGGGGDGSIYGGGGTGGNGGSDGSSGMSGSAAAGGSGQGTTTRAFGDVSGELFSGGGGGLGTNRGSGGAGGGGSAGQTGTDGTPNTGGGGGGGTTGMGDHPGKGGSGVILIRWRWKS